MAAMHTHNGVERRFLKQATRSACQGVWAISTCVVMMAAAQAQTQTSAPTPTPNKSHAPVPMAAQPKGTTTAADQPVAGRTATTMATDSDGDADIEMIESAREYTYQGSYWLARTVNSWFGDTPFEGKGKVSGYVRLNGLWDQREGTKVNARFRLRVRLPNLQDRAYAFIGQDNKDEIVRDQPNSFSREQLLLREDRRQDQSFFAGLGYGLRDNIDFRVGFRGGLNPYVQARYRNEWELSPRDMIYFRESLFWSAKDSFGSTTVVDYEHALSSSLLVRWSTVGTITRRTDGFEWQSGLGLIKDFPGIRTASVEALVQGSSGEVDVSNYGVRTSWRQPVYKDWVFGKVTLGHFWPKDKQVRSREQAWALGASLDMHF